MANFKRLMVGLDFSQADAALLAYTKMMQSIIKPSIIYFVHVEANLDLPPEVLEELGISAFKPSDEGLLEKMQTKVAEYFTSDNNCEIVCQIVEGSPFEEMLHWSHIKNVDLLIVGKKSKENGKGVVPQKLARKIDGSILFVPEYLDAKPIKTVLLPIDFSKKSKLSIDTATQLFEDEKVDLLAANCYSLPLGWHKTGKTREEFDEMMRRHANNKFEQFLDGYGNKNLKIRSVFRIDDNHEPSEEILSIAEENNADIILIGSSGKTDIATVILGSTTEKILGNDTQIPVFVIKKKGETIGFLDAIFKLR